MSDAASLFTARFFVMCAFSFTAFLSAFQLLPTAPFRVLALGGGQFQAGMFLGFLTYASALSAPFTGATADWIGRRRTLVIASLATVAFAGAYAVLTDYRLLLVVALVHGIFWSSLLSASAAYITELIPASRRAEGIGYWGLATVFATAFAPSLGLWLYRVGWTWVCGSVAILGVVMALVALRLEDDRRGRTAAPFRLSADVLEWRITVVAFTYFLCAFGHGGIMSFVALYADANHVSPRGLYFLVFAFTIVASRPFALRLADRIGHVRVFVPCLVLAVGGYLFLAVGGTSTWLVLAGITFGLGFGSAYPIFAAMVTREVAPARRGAAFGSIIAAFDTGIGTGSMVIGWIIEHHGFRPAWLLAAALGLLSVPYFLLVAPRFLPSSAGTARQVPLAS